MATRGSQLLSIILPKRRTNDRGTGFTGTFNSQNPTEILTAPRYRDHLEDLFSSRSISDSREILKGLFRTDSDLSAAVNAYLTVADTEPVIVVRDLEGQIDRDGHKIVNQIILGLTTRSDYSQGFMFRPSLRSIAANMRYMALLRGGVGAELVFDKTLVPREIRHIDLATVEWVEPQPGVYQPIQKPEGSDDEIDLNIPSFFVAFYRQDPTTIYPYSPFVAAINTIAARQQVINDLYRIMQVTGYPRLDVKVMEEVLRRSAPVTATQSETEMRGWINARITEISNSISSLRADQAWVHTDAVEGSVLNEGGPRQSMDVSAVIEVLNAQNQAALKVMATIIGRGESGVNTASVEAAIFAKNAEQLNEPIGDILSQMLTLALRLQGSESTVTVRFAKVDLRPELELENQQTMRQARHTEALSYGLITDDEFHLRVYNRLRPDEVDEMAGTLFYAGTQPKAESSPNTDPVGRAASPDDTRGAKSKQVKGPSRN